MSITSPRRIHAGLPAIVVDVPAGTELLTVSRYLDADIKILTGEIKPHFMASFSGGRKVIGPGLANLETLQKFHSPQFLEHPRAANLILAGNPCHQEATEVAERVGTDFLINVTMNEEKQLTGVYAGQVQHAIQRTLATWQQRLGRMPRLGVIRDGAHAMPRLIGASTTV